MPKNTILTPHIGDFEKLIGKCDNHFQRIEKLKEFSKKYKCIVVLKGKYSAIATINGKVFFNPTGNSGMASGGSGDVLTGIITALLAQNYSPENAAILSANISILGTPVFGPLPAGFINSFLLRELPSYKEYRFCIFSTEGV